MIPDRPTWQIQAPPGGWGTPWPQAMELLTVLPATRWTLVGGLMVQLHAAHAGLSMRATRDIDMVLHIETGAITFPEARAALTNMGYVMHFPVDRDGPLHRFTRGDDQIDCMIADHLPPQHRPHVGRHPIFQLPAGTAALQRTINCDMTIDDVATTISIPDVLGALVLKGAAYRSDTRDAGRHLDDAAVLACTITDLRAEMQRMHGSDRSRIQVLASALADRAHRSWQLLPEAQRAVGQSALAYLARNPQQPKHGRRLGQGT